MKIAVISDTHDHIFNLQKAVKQINQAEVAHLFHCGDLISPFMLEELDACKCKVHLVFGNNPGDQYLLAQKLKKRAGHMEHYGWRGEIELSGRRIAWIHDPHLAYALARTGDYDLVCCGHTHRWRLESLSNGTLLLNPGEILGKKEDPGWALVDLNAMEVKQVLLD